MPSERPTILDRVYSLSPDERYPWGGQWELTCRCNLKCLMCYTDCFNTPKHIRQELTTEEIFRILDELQEAGCVELTLTGGEPISRPDFKAIYEKAHRLGFFITIFTNGTLITEEIADLWGRARPQSVEISLHGISPAGFERVTQVPRSLERCLHAIQLLMSRQVPIVLKTVGLTVNQEEVLSIKRYAESLGKGVTWKFGQYMRDDLEQSGAPFQYQLSEEELQGMEKLDPELWKAKCEEIEKSESMKKSSCGGGKMKFHIDAYGRLQLCSMNRRASFDLRKGSFRRGFYELLPTFPCPGRRSIVSHQSCDDEAVSCQCKCEV